MKEVVAERTHQLIEHERDSQLMAQKLTQMKIDMMDSEKEYGTRRKYGAVRVSGPRLEACTVSKNF
jgi:hypothetical protein